MTSFRWDLFGSQGISQFLGFGFRRIALPAICAARECPWSNSASPFCRSSSGWARPRGHAWPSSSAPGSSRHVRQTPVIDADERLPCRSGKFGAAGNSSLAAALACDTGGLPARGWHGLCHDHADPCRRRLATGTTDRVRRDHRRFDCRNAGRVVGRSPIRWIGRPCHRGTPTAAPARFPPKLVVLGACR